MCLSHEIRQCLYFKRRMHTWRFVFVLALLTYLDSVYVNISVGLLTHKFTTICVLQFINVFLGFTPLHHAVMLRNIASIRLLLHAGADVDYPDGKSGRTPLFHAAEENQLDVCEALLGEGKADPNVANYAGVTAVYAASGRKLTQVVALLVRYGADVCIPISSDDIRCT